MNNYELSIEPIRDDLSHLASYLDSMNFQLLTQIAPYKNNNIWTALSLHGYGSNPSDIYKPGFVKSDIYILALNWSGLVWLMSRL